LTDGLSHVIKAYQQESIAMFRTLLTIALGVFTMIASATQANTPAQVDLDNMLYLDLKDGRVTIKMFPDKAPAHVARIKELTREGYYNGKKWHRVIDGFMAQTGSPKGDGMGGSSKPDLKAEFNDVMHVRGIVSMARSMSPNSANAQFFIMLKANNGLDGQYTAWGQVVDGMEHVDAIKKGDEYDNGTVTDPDTIVKMTVASDEGKVK
jgi:peptidylprolyl isomerase